MLSNQELLLIRSVQISHVFNIYSSFPKIIDVNAETAFI